MGKNCFVSLILAEDFILSLYKICLEIQSKINEKFIPMEKEDIHMTLCFLGQVLNKGRKEKMIICDKNFKYFRDNFTGNILEFDSFSLFGTHQNLIVAKFKCKNNKNFINKMIGFKKMFCEIGAKEEDYFTPHITLGKINNFVPDDKKIDMINKILSEITKVTTTINIDGCELL